MSDWEQDVVEMLAGCNIDGKGDPIEENEVIYALGKDINEQVLHRLTLIVMREVTFIPLPFLDWILSAEFSSKIYKKFWR
jgi:hypothetical protein